MAELADAQDSKSCVRTGRGGSSPSTGIDEPIEAPLTPDQHFHVPLSPCEGERALMRAVLEEAVQEFRNTRGFGKLQQRKHEETWAWFARRHDPWYYSFENICGALGLDAERFRKSLLAQEAPLDHNYYKRHMKGRSFKKMHV